MPGEPLGGGKAGFYGKLPARGDFVSRRLPRSFVEPWDAWLQQGFASSRDHLGDGWLEAYLTSPIWRFVLAPGVCGPAGVAGVVMPSVDSVGRYFPLTIAQPTEAGSRGAALLRAAAGWFAAAEDLAMSALADGFDVDAFDEAVAALALPAVAREAGPPGPPDGGARAAGWHLACGADAAFATLADLALESRFGSYCLWAAESDLMEPALLVTQGLPGGAAATALLDGRWQHHGWAEAAGTRGGGA